MRVHKAVTSHPLPDFRIAIVGLLAILRLERLDITNSLESCWPMLFRGSHRPRHA